METTKLETWSPYGPTQSAFSDAAPRKGAGPRRERLVAQGKPKPAELLSLYKKFLKIENHRLQLKHYAGAAARETAEQRATVVDIALRHLFEPRYTRCSNETAAKAVERPRAGGDRRLRPGRAEPDAATWTSCSCKSASVKTLLAAESTEVIQSILYMLWDVGFKVGHSTRSMPGAVQAGECRSCTRKTALLEARFLAGDKALFDQFKMEFQRRCVRGHREPFSSRSASSTSGSAMRNTAAPFTCRSRTSRTVAAACATTRTSSGSATSRRASQTTQGLVEKKLLQEAERRKLERAYDFLLRVRTELHYLNKRATDVLSLNFQLQIATKFQYPTQERPAARRGVHEGLLPARPQHLPHHRTALQTGSARRSVEQASQAFSGR